MSKGIGEKLLGLFIEEDVDETAAASQPEQAPAPKTAPAPAAAVRAPVVPPGARHDAASYAAVYRGAGLPDSDRDRLAKVIALVESLASEASPSCPVPTKTWGPEKRAIVSASLRAFGVPIDGVVSTGNAAVAALDAYVIEGERRTKEVLSEAEIRIAKLGDEIEAVRRLMAVQVDAQQELVRATSAERARVRLAIDFFDQAGAPAPARLRRVR